MSKYKSICTVCGAEAPNTDTTNKFDCGFIETIELKLNLSLYIQQHKHKGGLNITDLGKMNQ